jgi:hypothetical protein
MGSGVLSAATAYDPFGHKTVDVLNGVVLSSLTIHSVWYEFDDANPNGLVRDHDAEDVSTIFDPSGTKFSYAVFPFGSTSNDAASLRSLGRGVLVEYGPQGLHWLAFQLLPAVDSSTILGAYSKTYAPNGLAVYDYVNEDGNWRYKADPGSAVLFASGRGFVLTLLNGLTGGI